MIFCMLNVIVLRIVPYLLHDAVNLLHFQVNDVVHDALCHLNVLTKLIKIESCFWRKRILNIAVKVDR